MTRHDCQLLRQEKKMLLPNKLFLQDDEGEIFIMIYQCLLTLSGHFLAPGSPIFHS